MLNLHNAFCGCEDAVSVSWEFPLSHIYCSEGQNGHFPDNLLCSWGLSSCVESFGYWYMQKFLTSIPLSQTVSASVIYVLGSESVSMWRGTNVKPRKIRPLLCNLFRGGRREYTTLLHIGWKTQKNWKREKEKLRLIDFQSGRSTH